MKNSKLAFHDEKHFGFWGGLYLQPESDDENAECVEVAAICEQPDAERFAHLFTASEDLLKAIELGVAMRTAQNLYFKDRCKDNLVASKQAEANFDKAAKAVLLKMGYFGVQDE